MGYYNQIFDMQIEKYKKQMERSEKEFSGKIVELPTDVQEMIDDLSPKVPKIEIPHLVVDTDIDLMLMTHHKGAKEKVSDFDVVSEQEQSDLDLLLNYANASDGAVTSKSDQVETQDPRKIANNVNVDDDYLDKKVDDWLNLDGARLGHQDGAGDDGYLDLIDYQDLLKRG